MSIKTEAQERFFVQYPEQQKLANALNEAFDITFGNQHGGQYMWLCAAKKSVGERFGLQKEVILLYSPHSKTDARTLTNLENISKSPDFRHRVDKVVALIIHEGDSEATADLLKQTNDWIIVAIQAEELKNPQRGDFFIRSRLAERIGTFDLFGMSSPIKNDKYFYGRDPLVQEVVQRISRRENSGIFGLRKTGKTSVLYALQRRLAGKDYLVEYIDCHGPGIYGMRWWQLLQELSYRLCQSMLSIYGKKIIDEGGYTKNFAANDFNRLIKRLFGFKLFSQITFLFDEVEFITPGLSNSLGQHWDEDFVPFWQTIRSVSQETEGALVFIVAGVNPSSVEHSHFDHIQNPIFQLAVPYYLEALGRPDVRDMVRSIGKYSGLTFNESCYDHLQQIYGGHPYLIRLACSEVERSLGDVPVDKKIEVTEDNFKTQHETIRNRISQPIKDILLSLVWWHTDEYDLLHLLAEGNKEFFLDFLKETPEKAIPFVRYGLVHQHSGEFAIRDLKDFLVTYGDEYKKAISPFKRGDLPLEALPEQANLEDLSLLFEKRTEIEVGLRKFILMLLGFKYGFDDKLISDRIISCLKTRPGKLDNSQLFVGRRPQDAINELFLSDLKPIFKANWEDFGPTFEKKLDRFDMNMDTINIARRYEAHAKPVPVIDRDEFLNSYSWFYTRLSKVPGLL
ncbi:hypothetical protein K8U54_06110 [Pseudomonas fulva]|uniref:hypothetical protein n=1 Tax=Pseudomonas fulva TaxID=47880 RepID=UPI00201DB603|nr:hypothetical protein [Pseudomonas fulva]UQY36056.1 hypothetical protein K8U54_06110 [Pseudomonas fulva]